MHLRAQIRRNPSDAIRNFGRTRVEAEIDNMIRNDMAGDALMAAVTINSTSLSVAAAKAVLGSGNYHAEQALALKVMRKH